jgi:hypothetical protein
MFEALPLVGRAGALGHDVRRAHHLLGWRDRVRSVVGTASTVHDRTTLLLLWLRGVRSATVILPLAHILSPFPHIRVLDDRR